MRYRKLGVKAVLGILLCFVLFSSPVMAALGGGPNAGSPDQLLLSWTENPLTTQTISWRSGTGITQGQRVQYLPATDYDGSFAAAREVIGKKSLLSDGHFQLEATLRGLAPGTVYVYRVGREGAWSEPALFTTADGEDEFSFLYMGDVQGDYGAWGKMLEQVATENPNLRFALLGGDLVDQGNSIEEWQHFFAAAEPVFCRLPLLPAVGNHDDSEVFRNSFALPRNGPAGYEETFYSFDYGNCHITVLDSNCMGIPGSGDYDQTASWLRQDLAGSPKHWKFVVLHHPPYQVVADWRGEHLQTNWVPLLEEGGVDLVFTGHQHVYMRTKPLREGRIRPDGQGIVYIMGNAGGKHYGPGLDYDYIAAQTAWVSNYQVVEIKGNTLTMTAKDAAGQVLDRYTLVKGFQEDNGTTTTALKRLIPLLGMIAWGQRYLPL